MKQQEMPVTLWSWSWSEPTEIIVGQDEYHTEQYKIAPFVQAREIAYALRRKFDYVELFGQFSHSKVIISE